MAKIKCPKCGEVFTVDEKEYADILVQIKNEEFNKELEARTNLIKEQNKTSEAFLKEQLKGQYEQELGKANIRLQELENKLNNKEKELIKQKEESAKDIQARVDVLNAEKENEKLRLESKLNRQISELESKLQKAESDLAVEKKERQHSIDNAVREKETEVEHLKSQIVLNEREYALEKSSIEKRHKDELSFKENEIAYYRDLKAKTNVKLLGESLEQHCLIAFNQIRMNSYPHAQFEKDNDVVEGTKGDFIFRDWTEDGAELISIMFEMKNESDISSTKHKNEDFFKKLDDDRKKKNCEYAVLVSLLEPDNEYYNAGIVDVSYEYPKMYVIRPQFFVSFIGLLYNAAKTAANEKNELLKIKNQNIDISNFEEKLYDFQDKFSKNYISAKNNFAKAIEEIDKTIAHLNKVKEGLLTADNQLRLANDKAQDLTIRKLTYNNPTMKDLFEKAKKDNEDKPTITPSEKVELKPNKDVIEEQDIDEIEQKTDEIANRILVRKLEQCRTFLFEEGIYNAHRVLTNEKINELVKAKPTSVMQIQDILGKDADLFICERIYAVLNR